MYISEVKEALCEKSRGFYMTRQGRAEALRLQNNQYAKTGAKLTPGPMLHAALCIAGTSEVL